MDTIPFIIRHRSITPPLYIGAATLVSKADEAMPFPTCGEAEEFLKSLGSMGMLYTVVPKLEILR